MSEAEKKADGAGTGGQADAAGATRTARRLARLAVLVPVLAGAVVFARVLTFDYVHVGDPAAVLGNPALVSGRTALPGDFLWLPGFSAPSPVAVASFVIQGEPRPDAPGKHHAVALLLHLAAVALTGWLALRLGTGALGAGLAGAIVALHPAVGEPIAWVTSRPYLLASLLGLLAMHAHLAGRRTLALGLWLVAVAAHPSAALLPIVLTGADRVRAGAAARLGGREWLLAAAGVALALALLGPLRWPGSDAAAGRGGDLLANAQRALLATGVRTGYLVWPATLGTLPGRPAGAAVAAAATLGATAGLLAVALLLAGCRRPSTAWLGLLWAVMAQVPALGLLPIERPWNAGHLYPSLPGLGLAAGALLGRGTRLGVPAAVAALVLAAGSTTFAQGYASSDELVTASRRVQRGTPEELLERARAARTAGHVRDAMRLLARLEDKFPGYRAHYRTKGDIFRDAGLLREAYWAYVFAVRTGDESACERLIDDTLAQDWTPGAPEAPEIRTCLRRVLPRIFGGDSDELRGRASALARKVGYTP